MPTKTTRQSARRRARRGNKASTQAGAYVREKMHKYKRGRGNARSRKQAIAIGLSEARRDGVNVKGRGKSRTAKSGGKPRRSTGSRRKSSRGRGKPRK